MIDPDVALERLRAADPAPPAPPAPDVHRFLADMHERELTAEAPGIGARSRVALAAAIVLVAGVTLWFGVFRSTDPDTLETIEPDPPVSTTTSTASTTTTTEAPTTTGSSATSAGALGVDDTVRALLLRFENVYNGGDADAFMALFQPGLNREVIVDSDRRLSSPEQVRAIYALEVGLNTTITLEDCAQVQDVVSCVPRREDDLHRILGVPPTADPTWNFRFDDEGLVRGWNERRVNLPDVDDYEREVTGPFADWIRETHPEVGDVRPAVAADWIVDKSDEILDMVQAFAESRGVEL